MIDKKIVYLQRGKVTDRADRKRNKAQCIISMFKKIKNRTGLLNPLADIFDKSSFSLGLFKMITEFNMRQYINTQTVRCIFGSIFFEFEQGQTYTTLYLREVALLITL